MRLARHPAPLKGPYSVLSVALLFNDSWCNDGRNGEGCPRCSSKASHNYRADVESQSLTSIPEDGSVICSGGTVHESSLSGMALFHASN